MNRIKPGNNLSVCRTTWERTATLEDSATDRNVKKDGNKPEKIKPEY